MSISCIIIDDEPLASNLLEEYVVQVPYLRLEKKCLTAVEALAHLQGHPVDLIFLDINLPQLSGMQLAHILPHHQKVIFTTAYTAYAVESYNINAIDYLLKPITFERFLKAVEKVHTLPKSSSGTTVPARAMEQGNFFIKSGKAMIKISAAEIYYVEGLKDYVIFQLEKEKHIVYKKMKELEEILSPGFKRIHHSFIVNVDRIKKIEDNQVYILDQRISISEKYRESFMSFVKNNLM